MRARRPARQQQQHLMRQQEGQTAAVEMQQTATAILAAPTRRRMLRGVTVLPALCVWPIRRRPCRRWPAALPWLHTSSSTTCLASLLLLPPCSRLSASFVSWLIGAGQVSQAGEGAKRQQGMWGRGGNGEGWRAMLTPMWGAGCKAMKGWGEGPRGDGHAMCATGGKEGRRRRRWRRAAGSQPFTKWRCRRASCCVVRRRGQGTVGPCLPGDA